MILSEFEIIGRIPSKKNSRVVTKTGRNFPSDKYKKWHTTSSWQIISQRIKPKEPFCNVGVEITVYFPDKRRADLTNKAESIMDLLVDNKILQDDSRDVVPMVVLIARYDKEIPRAVVRIKEYYPMMEAYENER